MIKLFHCKRSLFANRPLLRLNFQGELIKSRVCLSQLKTDDWTPEVTLQLTNFMQDPSQLLLTIYYGEQTGLILSNTFPTSPVKELAYFIRTRGEVITSTNFSDLVQYGTLLPDHVTCLLRTMQGMYAPSFFMNTIWPSSILYCNNYYFIL